MHNTQNTDSSRLELTYVDATAVEHNLNKTVPTTWWIEK